MPAYCSARRMTSELRDGLLSVGESDRAAIRRATAPFRPVPAPRVASSRSPAETRDSVRARSPCSLTNSAPARPSTGVCGPGITPMLVNPPASAAAVPVAIVSSSSLPGSPSATRASINPGQTIIPAASIVSSALPPGPSAMQPSLSHKSATSRGRWLGR